MSTELLEHNSNACKRPLKAAYHVGGFCEILVCLRCSG